jgi:DNA polymerase-3 subunit delta
MKPAYLFSGSDSAKIAETRARLRARAEAESGASGLEVFEPIEGRGSPDADAVCAAIPAMSLVMERRYLLVDGVEKWRDSQAGRVAEAMASLPPETTLVLIGHGKVSAKLAKAVTAIGGEVRQFEAPKAAEMPRYLVAQAQARGFTLALDAARDLVQRMGTDPVRLGHELDRLALWAGPGGEVGGEDLAATVADTSEAAVWSLSDAVLEGDGPGAIRMGEELLDQGESLGGLIYSLAGRLRQARQALIKLAAGMQPRQVEGSLGMHPYAARQMIARLRGVTLDDIDRATEAVARLEFWTRGGAEYDERLALTLCLRQACDRTV